MWSRTLSAISSLVSPRNTPRDASAATELAGEAWLYSAGTVPSSEVAAQIEQRRFAVLERGELHVYGGIAAKHAAKKSGVALDACASSTFGGGAGGKDSPDTVVAMMGAQISFGGCSIVVTPRQAKEASLELRFADVEAASLWASALIKASVATSLGSTDNLENLSPSTSPRSNMAAATQRASTPPRRALEEHVRVLQDLQQHNENLRYKVEGSNTSPRSAASRSTTPSRNRPLEDHQQRLQELKAHNSELRCRLEGHAASQLGASSRSPSWPRGFQVSPPNASLQSSSPTSASQTTMFTWPVGLTSASPSKENGRTLRLPASSDVGVVLPNAPSGNHQDEELVATGEVRAPHKKHMPGTLAVAPSQISPASLKAEHGRPVSVAVPSALWQRKQNLVLERQRILQQLTEIEEHARALQSLQRPRAGHQDMKIGKHDQSLSPMPVS